MKYEHHSYARSDRIVVAYARMVLRFRWLVVAAVLLAVAAAGYGSTYMVTRSDYRYEFRPDNPQLMAFEAMEEVYGRNDSILFFIAPESENVFHRDSMAAVYWLTEQAWQIPFSTRVDSLTNYQHTEAVGDDLEVMDLVEDPAALDDAALERIRAISLAEPLIVGRLLPEDGSGTTVAVTVHLPEGETGHELELYHLARGLAAETEERFPGHRVAISGLIPFSGAFEEAGLHDLSTLVPLMYGVLIVTLFLFLRSTAGTVGTMLVAAFSAVTGMGAGFWLGIPFTQGAAIAPTIILTIAIADGVHILVTFTKERRAGRDHHDAMVEAIRINWQPVFLTSLTTAIGFLSLNLSESTWFRDLGNLTAMGVGAAWLYSITFLPAFISLLPYRIHAERHVAGLSMERFAEWMIARRRPVLVGMSALLVVMGLMIPRIELNDTFTTMFDEDVEFRRHLDFMSEHLPGLYMFQYSLGAGGADEINDPAYWAKLDEFAAWLRAQPEATHVQILSDTLKRLNRNMHGDDPAAYRLPAERDQAAQYLLLYEMSLPYGLDLNNQINVKRSSTRVTVTVDALSSRELRGFDDRIQAWLRANAPESMHAAGASVTLMFAHMSARNVTAMISGTMAAFALISLMLAISLRSLKLGVISLIPNIGPTVIAFGVWALLIGEAGFSVSMVSACSLGIIVDATVHFLSKYLRARRERDVGAEDAVRYAISTVGAALWITFLVLIMGFSVLTLSPIETNSLFGLMIAITIGAALLTSFLLLPTLLIQIEGEGEQEALAPGALRDPLQETT